MKKIILIISLTFLQINLCFSQKIWERKADLIGEARNSAMSFSINGKGYVGLGQNLNGQKLWDFYEYDPLKNSWQKKSDYPGAGSHTTCAFSINGKGYICLGVNNSGIPQNDVWEYDPTYDKWTKKTNFPGLARYGASSFVINDTAFLLTGSTGGPPYLEDVWMYVPAIDKWTQKSNFPGGSRLHGATFTINGVGYFGTGIVNSTTATNDVWRYNKLKDTWTQIANYPYGEITGAIGFEVDGSGYLGTGYNLSYIMKDIYEYFPTTNSWKILNDIPYDKSVRGGAVTFAINSIVYIATGYYSISGGTVYSLKDVWAYIPKCNLYVIKQPKNINASLKDNVTFSINSSDSFTTYKWQVNSGMGYSDISDGIHYSGTNTKQLKVINVKFSLDNGNKYRCIAKGKSCSDTSNEANLIVNCKSLITKDPIDMTVNIGENAKFIISKKYLESLIQWQINDGNGFENILNSTKFYDFDKDTLTVLNVQYSDNNSKYRCIVSNEGCKDTSDFAILSVNCKKIIKNQPVDITVKKGNQAYFIVKSYETGSAFQWQTNLGLGFQNLSNAGQYKGCNNDTLIVNDLTILNNNQIFRCVLSNIYCKDTSNEVRLTVAPEIAIEIELNKIYLYPNPCSKVLFIELSYVEKENRLLIYNSIGQLVYEDKLLKLKNELNLEKLSSGIYLIRYLSEMSNLIEKLIIDK